jgi:hypothetical protein
MKESNLLGTVLEACPLHSCILLNLERDAGLEPAFT